MAYSKVTVIWPTLAGIFIYIIIGFLGEGVKATHFRGGTVSWKPSDSYSSSYKEVIFTFKLGWRLSRIGCDERTITSGDLVGEDARWFCMYGCKGVLASTREKCTEFNLGEDWMFGSNTFKHVFDGDGPMEISYMECCWLTDLVVGAGGEWALTTILNLGIRSDTGGPNSSPVTAMAPMIALRAGVSDVIDLAVRDSDGDRVSCRLGRHVGECGTICSLFAEFTLDEENCLIKYTPVSNTTGKIPVAIMVEDHHRSVEPITLGKKSFLNTDALSAVPVQFIVVLNMPPTSCADKPLIDTSIPPSIPIKVRSGRNLTFTVASTPCDVTTSIDEFILIAPIGVRKSSINKTGGVYSTEITWTPDVDQDGSNLICVTARSSNGVLSDQVCITVDVPKATAFCAVVGGSHFITFDDYRYNFYGTCKYRLVGMKKDAAIGLTPFNISLLNEETPAANNAVRVGTLEVEIMGQKVTIDGERDVYLDDVLVNLPIRMRSGLRVEKSGRGILIGISLAIRIHIDDGTLSVHLPQSYMGSVEGLCGNYNRETEDDLVLPGGIMLASNEIDFAANYQIDDGKRCRNNFEARKDEQAPCSPAQISSAKSKCSIISEKNAGCFTKCHEIIEPANFYDNCVTVLCKTTDDFRALDVLVRAYADACQREAITICDWRSKLGITMECAPNSHYEKCATTVPATCADSISTISPTPSESCVEGCVCNNGYILSGNICVPESECGCIINDIYYPKGFTYRDEGCERECVCGEDCKDVDPCNRRAKCQKGSDGFYRCIEKLRESATCKATTDPHYQTFDGTKFDSMGTCAYIMVRSKRNATTSTAFTVVTVNEAEHGTKNASRVKEIHVMFGDGHTLTFARGPKLILNDKEINPGSSLYGLEVRRVGTFTVADFNFGLVVRWDGIDRLRITAWSPLRYMVEGLCGDFDDNPTNDFAVRPTEENVPDPGSFAESWRIEGYGTDGCSDHPGIDELQAPCKDQASLDRYVKECQVLSDPKGSFSFCHEFVDPQNAVKNCIYDLCALDGDKTIKERMFASYVEDCLEQKAPPQAWRDTEGMTPVCINGTYSICMEQCQPTCADPTASICLEKRPNQLGSTCVEGCVCADGLVLSGDTCVKPEDCGCMINGRYEKRGFSFAIANCAQTCVCNGPDDLVCAETPDQCQKNRDSCRQRSDGYFECYERQRRRATCKAVTDPHYQTFDGKNYDSMGTCSYIMVRSKENSGLRPFRVVTVNEQPWPNRTVSHVKEAWIHLDDLAISLTKGGIVKFNGQLMEAGTNMTGIKIFNVGRFIVVAFDFGLTVRWDGMDRLRISAWQVLRGKMEGLCGDFDDDETNDFMKPDGEVVTEIAEFVNSWKVGGYENDDCRDPVADEPELSCPKKDDYTALCSTLESSIYDECRGVVETKVYIQNCITDFCAYYGDEQYRERLFSEYFDECAENNVILPENWRELDNLKSIECDENSHPESCFDQCQPTCTDPDGSACRDSMSLGTECVEGCVCDDGYILSGTKCVLQEECGCLTEKGTYVQQGFTYRTRDCEQECICGANGVMQCSRATNCTDGYRCRFDADGFKRCILHVRRRATCKAVTDPHYMTFDGIRYDSMGTCAYIMARTKQDANVTPFRVVAVNERGELRHNVSSVKEVFVYVGDDITIHFKKDHVVTVNGEIVLPGTTIEDIEFRKVGRFTVAEFPFGLVVRWDGIDRLRIMAWAKLKGTMEGLCGDFNDDQSNDFMTPDGVIEPRLNEFVNSWQIDGYDSEGCVGPPKEQKSPCDTPEKLAEYQESCKVLIAPDSPLLPCFEITNPNSTFHDCVFDLCAYNGDPLLKERIISSYTEDCREIRVADEVPPGELVDPELKFRETEVEAILCPDNSSSHFAYCISPCQPTCNDKDASKCLGKASSTENACVDACKCNDGYVLSGNECVPEVECGCQIDGRYVPKGFTYNNRNCTEECSCIGNGEVICQAREGCPNGMRCRIDDDGKRACVAHIRRRATCKAVTDPHYMTFDGVRYDSMGTCAYIMARSKAEAGVTQFRVVAVNERGDVNETVSSVKEVFVYVGDDITVHFQRGHILTINGEVVLPGTTIDGIEIRKVGRFIVAEFPFGLVVRWDGIDRLRVMAWAKLKGTMEGLCGDFNDDQENDFTTPEGVVVTELDEFVNSWKIDGYDTEDCEDAPKTQESPCKTPEKLAEFREACKMLIDPDSPLLPCFEIKNPNSSFNDCVFDMCAYNGDPVLKERVISSYTEDCREEAVSDETPPGELNFREPEVEAAICPDKSHFVNCMPSCQPTCDDKDASKCLSKAELPPCVDACKCDDGYILSGNECVREVECGCRIDGRYIPKGFVYNNRNCTRECTCIGNEELSCVSKEGCGKELRCRINTAGRRACIPHVRRRATCKAVTDPHYKTFDGRSYDSMGTCAYVMVRSRSDAEVEKFRVVAVNEQPQPHQLVSHVKEVHVDVGKDFRVSFEDGGVIKINGDEVLPGTKVRSVQIRKVGRFTVAEFDFGLVVKWDGVDRLRIMAWAVLKNKVEGLCGDFNDDPENDFTTSRGVIENRIGRFVRSWKINEFSEKNCIERPVPPGFLNDTGCGNEKVYLEYSEICSAITDPEGQFKNCLEFVDPQVYYENCLFDMCATDGDTSLYERNVGEYTDACLESEERPNNPNITEECPDNMISRVPMEQCQPTCDDLDASACKANSTMGDHGVAGCVCNPGLVLSGNKCVAPNECGCLIDGKYREKGFTFLQQDCDVKCECTGVGDVICLPTEPCLTTERCTKVTERYKCTPHIRDKATCKAFTDPHHTTFDGKTFDSTGTCAYIMTKSLPASGLTPFRVIAKNERLSSLKSTSSVKEVVVEVGTLFKMEIFRDLRVRINGVFYEAGSTVMGAEIREIGLFTVVEFPLGLVVRWDGKDRLRVTVWDHLKGKVEGLCGRYNDDMDDDFTMPDGVTNDVTEFVSSWAVEDQNLKKCEHELDEVPNNCSAADVLASYQGQCDILTDAEGPFARCHRFVDPKSFYDACVSDLCRMDGDLSYKDRVLTSYVHDCLEFSKGPDPWRLKEGLPIVCGANSKYSRCMQQCQPTCSDPDASKCKSKVPSYLGSNCVEGCKCNPGFMLSGDKCVRTKHCGCMVGLVYYKKGFKYRSNDCRRQCKCRGQNVFECEDIPDGCLASEKCKMAPGGYFQCMPGSRRRATCKAITDPHYTTFDGTKFDSQGSCSYTMVRTKAGSSVDAFHVVAINEQPLPKTRVSHVKEIHVTYRGQKLSFYAGPVAELNGEVVNAGTSQSGMKLKKVGRYIAAVFDFGLNIRWDGSDRMRIMAMANLRGQVEGVCGDFNDDPTDDMTHAISGEVVTDPEDFVNSWRVQGYDDGCPIALADSLSEEPSFTCGPKDFEKAHEACFVLINPEGVLKNCKRLSDAETSYENCLLDMCAYAGDKDIHERVISSFSEDCREEGGELDENWRQEANLTEVKCPPNSHFETCMSQCQPSCDDVDASDCNSKDTGDNCVEGCQANDGFVISGDDFVPVSECGCLKDGRYYKSGDTFYTPLCQTKCECKAGIVTCNMATCGRNEECTINNVGKLDCVQIEMSTCEAWGSTHFRTFDGLDYDLSANCFFYMVKRELIRGNPRSRLEAFFLSISIVPSPDNEKVTIIKNVRVRFPSQDLTILLRPGAQVGGKSVLNWRSKNEETLITVDRRGTYTLVKTFFGLEIAFDGTHLKVTLPKRHIGKTLGLCGNFNGDASDDLMLENGIQNDDVTKFALQYSGCKNPVVLPPVTCSDEDKKKWSAPNKCGVIVDPNSEFANCSSNLNSKYFFEKCVEDVCRAEGSETILAQILKTYAHQCMDIDMPVCEWRRDQMLQIPCPVNSHYVGCTAACEDTCGVAPETQCRHQRVEDCVCDEGYIRSNGGCIPKANCGRCRANGQLISKGFAYRSADCSHECTCVGNMFIVCEKADKCIRRAECGKDNLGFTQCLITPREKATCQAFGNGHFVSFDGTRFDSTVTCVFTMARSRADSGVPKFSVDVDMQTSVNSNLSRVAQVIITTELSDIVMAEGRAVIVNGREVAVGSVLESFSVRTIGSDVAVVFDFGVIVRWDGKHNLRIEAQQSLAGKIEGLCGDFDEDESNDYRTSTGVIESDLAVFISSWIDTYQNMEGCRKQHTPTIEKTCETTVNLEGYKKYCEGTYKNEIPSAEKCDLQKYCLFEMCASNGDTDYVDENVQSFYQVCNEEQRDSTLPPVFETIPTQCPDNSHFASCMEQCQPTCSDHDSSICKEHPMLKGGCVSGCKCDDGYVLDRETCVKKSDCGCVSDEGEYYPNLYHAYLEDCESKCRCVDGRLFCEDEECREGQFCGYKNETYGCHWEDECKYQNGGCDHVCSWIDKEIVCSCRDGFNLSSDRKTCEGLKPECKTSQENLEEWKEQAISMWLQKLDSYTGSMKQGTENGNPVYVCTTAWTEWFDGKDPNATGEFEQLETLKSLNPNKICERPVAIEAQLTDGRSAYTTGLIFRSLDAVTGLQCFNEDQRSGETCGDFKVRFLCLEELI